MTDEKPQAAVTRAELYPILGSIYLLLAFALLGHIRGDDILRVIAYFILFGVAIALSLTFNILGFRERRRQRRVRSDLAAPGAPADGGRNPGSS